ncbi:MAG: Fic family protein [Thiomargarita sp.]|nr:Fic family protein [Thiomargarita sp.]
MKRTKTGFSLPISTVGERCHAFIPHPLPPTKPPLHISDELRELIDNTLMALGRLDSISLLLPDTSLFLYMYIRKEAVLSSQIEGTQSTLSDLLLFENDEVPGVPLDDVLEVSNYVAAITHGITRLKEGFPLSLRLIKEMHSRLLEKGRGSHQTPGEFRKTQNWIGGNRPGNALFVPPPPEHVMTCMGDLEKFLHAPTPLLIKAALSHVQFETIHPFLDGNGRLGRLIVTLLLCAFGALKQPVLYLSLYFKTHRQEYYELLQSVRMEGNWEKWVHFFMTGVLETSTQAIETTQHIINLFETDSKRIHTLGKATGSILHIHRILQEKPILSIAKASTASGLSVPTITTAFKHLNTLGIVKETTGRKRGRLYMYSRYIEMLT